MNQSDFQIERAVLIMVYENLREGNSRVFRRDGESLQKKNIYLSLSLSLYIYIWKEIEAKFNN